MHGSPTDDASTSVVEAWLARRLGDVGDGPGPQDRAHGDHPTDGLLHALDRVDDGPEDGTAADGAAENDEAFDDADEGFDPDEAWLALACGSLPPLASVERVAALHSLVARVQAMESAALADLTRAMSGEPAPELRPDGSMITPARAPVAAKVIDAIAPALCLGRAAAARRIQDADQLTRCLPTTHQLLAGGFIDAGIAQVVIRGTASCSEALAVAVDRSLAHELIGVTAGRARSMVETEIALQDASAITDRVATAIKGRRVEYRPAPDGLGELRLIGPAPAVRALHDTLTARAKGAGAPGGDIDPYADVTNPPDQRDQDHCGMDAKRFDHAITALNRTPDGSSAVAPPVEIAVGISTLLGLDDQPAHLTGHGALPAPIARAWAQRGRLRRFLTDPTTGTVIGIDGHTYPPGTIPRITGDGDGGEPDASGEPDGPGDGPRGNGPGGGEPPAPPLPPGRTEPDESLPTAAADEGPATPQAVTSPAGSPCPNAAAGYRIPTSVRRLVTLAMPHCVAPGCSVPASRCDLDHQVPWPTGPTCTCNLAPLCRTHHRMKHERGWSVSTESDANDHRDPTLTWTSPTGATYEMVPTRRWTANTTDPAAALRAAERRRAARIRRGEDPDAPEGLTVTSLRDSGPTRTTPTTHPAEWRTDPDTPPPF